MTYFTTIHSAESLFEAIARAGFEANRRGMSSYMIVCSTCGDELNEEHTPEHCRIIQFEFPERKLRMLDSQPSVNEKGNYETNDDL